MFLMHALFLCCYCFCEYKNKNEVVVFSVFFEFAKNFLVQINTTFVTKLKKNYQIFEAGMSNVQLSIGHLNTIQIKGFRKKWHKKSFLVCKGQCAANVDAGK